MKSITIIILFVSLGICAQNSTSKKLYFKDGLLAKQTWFNNQNKIDSVKTYYSTGELNEAFYYDTQERFHGTCYLFNKKREVATQWQFKNGKLLKRVDILKKYTPKNKETVLKRYKNIEELNKILKDINIFDVFVYRAYNRCYLGNKILALDDFFKIEQVFKKRLAATQNKKTEQIYTKKLANLYDQIAGIYSAYEQEEQAIHYKYLAIKHNPNDKRLVYNLGGYLVSLRDYELGIFYLNDVIKKHPMHPFANWALSIAYTDLEKYQKAQIHLDKARVNEKGLYTHGRGNSERGLDTVEGYIQHKLGNTDKGIALLNDALNTNKNNSFAKRYLGEIYMDLENYEVACDFFNESEKLGYTKKHDREDLHLLLEKVCNHAKTSVNNKLKIYATPNPVKHITSIKNVSDNFAYTLYNYQQQIIKKGHATGKSLDFSLVPAGLYLLKLHLQEKTIILRIIKQ
ncbi:T9SS type A sorting domain-containing protein [Ochrovirga pacifica]|uniref:T9SS type A sorting domain-containing protein n=1 Tax=Ochrovirga pacifica TaxID=1042376 RepID=UPI0002557FDA|nr:T9SS type A sorting domain-containing protein [Ochrovirga pacifica]